MGTNHFTPGEFSYGEMALYAWHRPRNVLVSSLYAAVPLNEKSISGDRRRNHSLSQLVLAHYIYRVTFLFVSELTSSLFSGSRLSGPSYTVTAFTPLSSNWQLVAI